MSEFFLRSLLCVAPLALGIGCSPDKVIGRDLGQAGQSNGTSGGGDTSSASAVAGELGFGGATTSEPVTATGGLGANSSALTSVSGGGVVTGGASSSSGTISGGTAGTTTTTAAGATGGTTSGTATECQRVACLGARRFLYRADRQWQPSTLAGTNGMLGSLLPEAEYRAITEATSFLVSFSTDANTVVLARVEASQDPDLIGTAYRREPGFVEYSLTDNWTGGKLVVSESSGGADASLNGEVTLFGSGVPVTASTRGSLGWTKAFEPIGDACALPLAVPWSGYVPVDYSTALSSPWSNTKSCAGIRDGYCDGACAGWLVLETPDRDSVKAIAYDPTTKALAGFQIGLGNYAICRGHFPPGLANGTAGWNFTRMDLASGDCR
jgi:hypothetical protein